MFESQEIPSQQISWLLDLYYRGGILNYSPRKLKEILFKMIQSSHMAIQLMELEPRG
jgi:hypothetical protein